MTLVPAPPTRIQLCGPTVVERDGERLDGRLPGRQGRLLFAYLVLNRHRLTSRDELAGAIWPQQLPAAAEAGLNALISKLRKILGAGIINGRAAVRLQLGEDVRVDVEDAAEAAHRAESQVALGHWTRAWGPSLTAVFIAEREFLPGEDAPWIGEQRQHIPALPRAHRQELGRTTAVGRRPHATLEETRAGMKMQATLIYGAETCGLRKPRPRPDRPDRRGKEGGVRFHLRQRPVPAHS